MDVPTRMVTLNLPAETADRLEAYAKRSNSPLGNAASRAINAGLAILYPSTETR